MSPKMQMIIQSRCGTLHFVIKTQFIWWYLRTGNVDEYKQTPIQQSKYHSQLEYQVDEDHNPDHKEGEPEIRYWSDFNRLYYTPRSIQRLPDTADWENVESDWVGGRETFQRFNEGTDLMEDSLRLFVEECDSLQVRHCSFSFVTPPSCWT